ncbi:MAG: hypothetical protein ACC608_03605 [Anaerofustis sp.]
MNMEMESEFTRNWEEYIRQNPDVAEIKNAKIMDEYEDGIVRFVLGLFI